MQLSKENSAARGCSGGEAGAPGGAAAGPGTAGTGAASPARPRRKDAQRRGDPASAQRAPAPPPPGTGAGLGGPSPRGAQHATQRGLRCGNGALLPGRGARRAPGRRVRARPPPPPPRARRRLLNLQVTPPGWGEHARWGRQEGAGRGGRGWGTGGAGGWGWCPGKESGTSRSRVCSCGRDGPSHYLGQSAAPSPLAAKTFRGKPPGSAGHLPSGGRSATLTPHVLFWLPRRWAELHPTHPGPARDAEMPHSPYCLLFSDKELS